MGRFVGYDPRVLTVKPRKATAKPRKDTIPHNVSANIVALQNRVQRSIDTARVATMVEYLHGAVANGQFADWGPIELITSDEPDITNFEVHHEISFEADADYFIADGQHRFCAVLDFVRAYPELVRGALWTQGLNITVVPAGRLEEWAGQAFHDRNYFAVSVRAGKALAVDTRDPLNSLAKQLAGHPVVERAGGVAFDRDTLLQGDTRFVPHTVLHRFVRGFVSGRPGIDAKESPSPDSIQAVVEKLDEYLLALGEVMPWFGDNREEFLARSSVVITALGVVGHDLMQLSPDEAGMRIARLRTLDWRRTNLSWVGVIGTQGEKKTPTGPLAVVTPASSRPAIDATIRFLRGHLGLLPIGQ